MTKKELQKKLDDALRATRKGGWVCPVCGAGMSPDTSRCPCVPYRVSPQFPPSWPTTDIVVMYGIG